MRNQVPYLAEHVDHPRALGRNIRGMMLGFPQVLPRRARETREPRNPLLESTALTLRKGILLM